MLPSMNSLNNNNNNHHHISAIAAKQFQLVEAFRFHANEIDSLLQAIKSYISSTSSSSSNTPAAAAPFGNPLHLAVSLSSKSVIDRIITEFCTHHNHHGFRGDDIMGLKSTNWINGRNSEGETPVHLAARLSRADVIGLLMSISGVDETIRDYEGRTPEESADNLKVIQVLQSCRKQFCQEVVTQLALISARHDSQAILKLFRSESRAYSYLNAGWIDINGPIGAEEEQSLLHIAARLDDMQLVEWCLKHGADPKTKDKRGKTPADVAGKESKVRLKHAIHQAPILAASLAQAASSGKALSHAGAPTLRGSLLKWTNYASGYKSRYFVLESTSLSYFQSLADYPLSCRGSISMLIAKIVMPDHNDKSRFDVLGKGSVRYALKARSPAEAKKWVWALNESKFFALDRQKQGKSIGESTDAIGEVQLFEDIDAEFGDVDAEGSIAGDHVSISHQSEGSLDARHSNRPSMETSYSNIEIKTSAPVPHDSFKEELYGLGRENSAQPTSLQDLQSLVYLLNVHLDVQQSMVDALIQAANQQQASTQNGAQATNSNTLLARNGTPSVISNFTSDTYIQTNALRQDITTDTPVDLTNLAFFCQGSSVRVSETVKKLIAVCEERERRWTKRWKAEIDSRKRWEEIVKKFVGLDTLTEEEMASAGDHHLGVVSAVAAGSGISSTPDDNALHHYDKTTSSSSKDNEGQGDDEVFYDAEGAVADDSNFLEQMFGFEPFRRLSSPRGVTSQRKAATGTMKSNHATLSPNTQSRVTSPVSKSSERADDDIKATPEAVDEIIGNAHLISLKDVKASAIGYPSTFRERLPLDPKAPRPTLNVWSFIRSAIGKDLSKVTLPVFFNEPLSMLQRMAEDVEYVEILNFAAQVGNHGIRRKSLEGMHLGLQDPASIHAQIIGCDLKDVESLAGEEASLFRTMLVAAYAMSNYSSTINRANKPFNPMLGETFELTREDKWYRYISEQTAHHPPVSACHCESPDYVFWTEVNVKSKFWGRSLELHPLGVCHVKLPIFTTADSPGQQLEMEHYSWRKVATVVNNLIVGKLWVDHLGDMVIKNHRTGEEVTVTFKSKATGGGGGGWFGLGGPTPSSKEDGGAPSDSGELGGFVRDRKGTIRYELKGNWGDRLIAVPVNPIGEGMLMKNVTLWARQQPPPISPQNFNYTALALTLNDLPANLREYLPLTDSRLRPDQKAMEEGLWDEASKLKEVLETIQRTNRKLSVKQFEDTYAKDGPFRKNPGIDFGEDWWIPRWFTREIDEDTGEEHWQFTNEYWRYRAENASNVEKGLPSGSGWPTWVPDIFEVKQAFGSSSSLYPRSSMATSKK